MVIDIFLDRDGTLIEDTGYISKIEDIKIMNSKKCRFNQAKYIEEYDKNGDENDSRLKNNSCRHTIEQ